MSLARQYTDEIFDERKYWGTWEPNVSVSLGTCGPVADRVFRAEGSLSDFEIGFSVEKDRDSSDVDYSSRSGLTYTFQTKVGSQTIPNIPQGKAGMSVKFGRQQATVLATKGSLEHRIANQHKLRQDILASAQKAAGGFPPGWFVITHLVHCTSASVIIAKGANAGFEVSADADFAAGVVDLANASLGLTIQSESQIGYKLLAQSGATPLFKGLRLKRNWFGHDKIETLGPGSGEEEVASLFEEISPDAADN